MPKKSSKTARVLSLIAEHPSAATDTATAEELFTEDPMTEPFDDEEEEIIAEAAPKPKRPRTRAARSAARASEATAPIESISNPAVAPPPVTLPFIQNTRASEDALSDTIHSALLGALDAEAPAPAKPQEEPEEELVQELVEEPVIEVAPAAPQPKPAKSKAKSKKAPAQPEAAADLPDLNFNLEAALSSEFGSDAAPTPPPQKKKSGSGSGQVPDDFLFLDVMRELVESEYESVFTRIGACQCTRCGADVRALTLTSLPSKYVVVKKSDVHSTLMLNRSRFGPMLKVALTRACAQVNERPHHDRPSEVH